MRTKQLLTFAIFLFFALTWSPFGPPASSAATGQRAGTKSNDPEEFLKSLAGHWEGMCRTWFQPGMLADESKINGEFKLMLDGRFVRHTYRSTIKGKPRTGEETIVFNAVEKKYEVYWFDDFHMNYAVMASLGDKTENGFSVTGRYRMAPGQAHWGWKTVFEAPDKDHLTITAYNISPDGQEAKAVETVYQRKSK